LIFRDLCKDLVSDRNINRNTSTLFHAGPGHRSHRRLLPADFGYVTDEAQKQAQEQLAKLVPISCAMWSADLCAVYRKSIWSRTFS
jgi:hypothetical protein